MKLVHLKVEKDEGDDTVKTATCSCRPSLYLDAEVLKSLGVSVRKLSLGDVMELHAKVIVSSVSEYRSGEEEARASLQLEFTDMAVGKAKTSDKAAFDDGFEDD